jgi:hypothetical protein
MSEAQYAEFGGRIQKIERHHRKLAKGYVTRMNPDGLVVARPSRQSSGLPARGFFLTLAAMLVFKVFLLAQLGVEGYNDRITVLENGSGSEKVGAFAMKLDPITQWLAGQFSAN